MNAITRPEERSDGFQMPARFDESWQHYDEADLAAIQAILPGIGVRADQIGMRMDEAGAYFARMLDFVKAQVYTVLRPTMNGEQLMVTDRTVPEWAETVSWQIYDEVGMAKIIGNYSDDLPRADVRGREMATRIQPVGDSYGYNAQELRAAAAGRVSLPDRRAVAARNAMDRKHNSLRLKGDTVYGLYGLANHPNIPAVSPVTGAHASSATGDQIVADVSALINAIVTQSNGVHAANVLGVDTTRLQAWRTKLTSSSGVLETAYERITRQFPGVSIVQVPEFAGAGSGSANILFAGERNAENYWYELPMDFTQHPPQARNLEFVVPCESRSGGFILARPLSVAVMSGV